MRKMFGKDNGKLGWALLVSMFIGPLAVVGIYGAFWIPLHEDASIVRKIITSMICLGLGIWGSYMVYAYWRNWWRSVYEGHDWERR